MQRITRFGASASLLFLSACATGGGLGGIVLFSPDQHVSSAEPLWGRNDEQCFDDPSFMMSIVSTGSSQERKWPEICGQIIQSIRSTLPEIPAQTLDSGPRYSVLQRNEVIDGIMAASDRKCGRYIAFLQQYDGNVNSVFGIAAQSAAILATVATGGAAQGLAAAAGIAGGARSTLNESHFNNQTIGVLASAFENVRREQREKIAELEGQPVASYTLLRGIEDVTRYHASCTIVMGLKEAQRNVEAARSPNLDTIKTMLEQLNEMRGAMTNFLTAPSTTVTTVPASPQSVPETNGTAVTQVAPPIPG